MPAFFGAGAAGRIDGAGGDDDVKDAAAPFFGASAASPGPRKSRLKSQPVSKTTARETATELMAREISW
jgi:hypothetical protein